MDCPDFNVYEYTSRVGCADLLEVKPRILARVSTYAEYAEGMRELPHSAFANVFYADHDGQTGVYVYDGVKIDGVCVFRKDFSPNKYANKLATTLTLRIFGCAQLDVL